jgi:aspartyl protease
LINEKEGIGQDLSLIYKIIIQGFLLITFILVSSSCAKRVSIEKKQIIVLDSIATVEYDSFGDAAMNFDFDYLDKHSASKEQKDLVDVLRLIYKHEFYDAKVKLKAMFASSKDSVVKQHSLHLLTELLFYENNWLELLHYDSLVQKRSESRKNEMLLAESFMKLPRTRIEYEEDSTIIDLEIAATGCPEIEVVINGYTRRFWFDTGANYTFLTQSTAAGCDIEYLSPNATEALTSTSREIFIRPAYAKKISFGSIHTYNNPLVIVMDDDLKFRSRNTGELVQIDGIIGWKTIQEFEVTMDFIKRKFIIKKDRYGSNEKRNFFWLGCPIVQVEHIDGLKLNYFYDTGSEETRITKNIFDKIKFDEIFSHSEVLGTAGGWIYNDRQAVATMDLYVSDYLFNFKFMGSSPMIDKLYIKLDGYLGNDFYKNSVSSFSIKKGRYTIQYPEGIPE